MLRVPPAARDVTLARARPQFYEGGWHNGLKNGWGTARYRNGDVYEGGWRDNKMCGNGSYTWSDGTLFTGQFEVRR